MRRLRGEPAHDTALAEVYGLTRCGECALKDVRDRTYCPSQVPENFGGLMIVGEGPGFNEARLKVPFVGKSGRLLDALLKQVGLRREECFVTNATLCKPDIELAPVQLRQKGKKGKWKDRQLASAVAACHARLRREIEIAQPRVIVALGSYALQAVTGRWFERTRRVPLFVDAYGGKMDCPTCHGEMTMAWWKCPSCKGVNQLGPGMDAWCGWEANRILDEHVFSDEHHDNVCAGCHLYLGDEHAPGCFNGSQPFTAACAMCQAPQAVHKIEKRKKRCPRCEGKKTRAEQYASLEADYKVSAASGLVFRGPQAPDFWGMEETARVDVPCRYVVGTYHPAFLDREPSTKSEKKRAGQFLVNATLAHLRKAKRLLEEDAYWPFAFSDATNTVHPDDPGALDKLDAFFVGSADPALFTSVDIETDNKDPWTVTDIRCVGFHAHHEGRALVPLVVNTSGLPIEHPIVQRLKAWLEGPAVKCAQHGIYDLQVLWHIYGIELANFSLDTMVAHNAVFPDEPHDLGHIAGVYTDSPPWKPPKKKGGKEIWESSARLREYNARDCLNTSLIMHRQLAELDAEGARFVHDLDVAMFHVARDMERAGLPIKQERWEYWRNRARFYAKRDLDMMRYFVGRDDFNPNAAPQLQWALYDQAGPCRLEAGGYTATGAPSANKAALLVHRDHPFVRLLLDYRRWQGLLSNILEAAQLRADWRIRTRWNAIGTRTGRWSTGGEEHGRKGNFQNWAERIDLLVSLLNGTYPLELYPGDAELVAPAQQRDPAVATVEVPGIRDVVHAPPGRKIVGADADQLELRIMAALSGDPTLIEKCKYADSSRKLEPGCDPHSYGCAIAFGEGFTSLRLDDETERRARERLRFIFKRVIYGMFYGAGAETILGSIYDGGYEGPPITVETIETVINAIFRAFPRVREWREKQLRKAEKTGRTYDALIGRRREFPLLKIDPTIVYNFPIQSSAGSLMNMSLWELRHALPHVDPSALIIAQVHDAIYIECDERHAEAVAALLERCMGQELVLVAGAEPMPFPCKAKIGQSWIEL